MPITLVSWKEVVWELWQGWEVDALRREMVIGRVKSTLMARASTGALLLLTMLVG